MDEDEEPTIKLNNALEQKLFEAFELFDHLGNKTVESQDIGTIIRSLGACPLQSEIDEMVLRDLEETKNCGTVHVSKFIPTASNFINAHKFEPPSPEALLEAFHVLDPLGKGYITREYITKLMTEEGEPFNQDEIDEMLEVAIDPSTQTVPYEFYINKLVYEPPPDVSLYAIADAIEAAKPKPAKKTLAALLEQMHTEDHEEEED